MKYAFDFDKEVFHGDMFAQLADVEIQSQDTPHDIWNKLWKSGCIVFCKTDYLSPLLKTLKLICDEDYPHQYVLVTHNSDFAIDIIRLWQAPPNVKIWFASNVDVINSSLIPLPLGMERPAGQGYSAHPEILSSIRKTERKIKNLCYMNHSNTTNPGKRQPVTDMFNGRPWVTHEEKTPFGQFVAGLWSHPFVFSPQGNGIDCLKTWEALWMNCIPICEQSTHMEYFEDLPILLVEDWEEVTESLLRKTLEEYESRTWDYSKIQFSYWKKRIRESA